MTKLVLIIAMLASLSLAACGSDATKAPPKLAPNDVERALVAHIDPISTAYTAENCTPRTAATSFGKHGEWDCVFRNTPTSDMANDEIDVWVQLDQHNCWKAIRKDTDSGTVSLTAGCVN
jgi:hypothetical protein